ncbi:MAG: hypothetical protein RLZZ127_109 [Planctomycetota bacterium]|jgi:threonine/homoserine/homoserine lactone efflux protein
MSADWTAVLLFAGATSITPGPNNAMLLASGARFGFRATVPHLVGISLGLGGLIILCGVGVGAVVMASPAASLALRILGSAYLLHLAWGLRRGLLVRSGGAERPMGVPAAALFQVANPKAWMMALSAVGTLMPDLGSWWLSLAVLTLIFMAVNLPCMALWALAGTAMQRWMEVPAVRRGATVLIILSLLLVAIHPWCSTVAYRLPISAETEGPTP